MSALTNAERQRRFRQLTSKERQLKADAFDLLLAAMESKQSIEIPLPDGRQLKVTQRDGQLRVQIVADAKMQSEVARARFRLLYGE
jgi:hypothetical protein